MNEAIILAGGLGSRLKSMVTDVPKPMAPVNGKPFLHYIFNYLETQRIDRLVLSVGYKHTAITDYFGDHFHDIPIRYVAEDEPLGTGGGISLALKECLTREIFILNGDTYFPVPLNKLKELHIQTNAEITIALKKLPEADRYGTIFLNEHSLITSFTEKKKAAEALINGGIYLLNKEKFEKRTFNDRFSFEKDYLEKIVAEQSVAGCVFDTYFIDIGIPESYRQAQQDLQQFS
jgi:D-glycero-alpha-D-manno-heptose 1-phosphate guanylyltransferase